MLPFLSTGGLPSPLFYFPYFIWCLFTHLSDINWYSPLYNFMSSVFLLGSLSYNMLTMFPSHTTVYFTILKLGNTQFQLILLYLSLACSILSLHHASHHLFILAYRGQSCLFGLQIVRTSPIPNKNSQIPINFL